MDGYIFLPFLHVRSSSRHSNRKGIAIFSGGSYRKTDLKCMYFGV